MVAITRKSSELTDPIDNSAPHRRPFVGFAVRLLDRIFAMAMADPLLRQKVIAVWVWLLAPCSCISWIPIQHQITGLHRAQDFGGLGRGGRVACEFVLEHQNHALLARLASRLLQLFVDGRAMRRRIIEPPEIEASDAIRMESFCQLQAALQHFILLLKRKLAVALVAFGT